MGKEHWYFFYLQRNIHQLACIYTFCTVLEISLWVVTKAGECLRRGVALTSLFSSKGYLQTRRRDAKAHLQHLSFSSGLPPGTAVQGPKGANSSFSSLLSWRGRVRFLTEWGVTRYTVSKVLDLSGFVGHSHFIEDYAEGPHVDLRPNEVVLRS